jgi:ABC-type multidrug transport system permease subunit
MDDVKLQKLNSPLYALVKVRLLEFIRDPAAIFWTFGFPIAMAIGLGLAFNQESSVQGKVAVTGPASQDLNSIFQGRLSDVRPLTMDAAQAVEQLKYGNLDLLIQTEPAAGSSPPVVDYHFDPSRPGALTLRCLVDQELQRHYGATHPVMTQDVVVREVGGRYIDFLLPGLIGINIMSSSIWGMGYSIVDARRRKLIKRFIATPMRQSDYLLSFMLSRLVFLITEVLVLTLFGYFVFNVAITGSSLALTFVVLLSAMAFSGISLLIASRTASTEVATGWMNFVQLPMWLLSGAYFSYTRFPELFHPFIKALPLTATNDALRMIYNQGAGWAGVLPECAVLLIWAVGSFFLALKYFRWS